MDESGGEREFAGPARPDAVLDTVGLYCPVPIIRTAEKMKALEPGAVLEVLSDDRVILIDMPAWCRSTRNQYLGSRRAGSEYHLFIRKLPHDV
ncbi:MAG TPA: sulfurtransferase TusA family protein [Candidatus Polarisedimenticolia bacterium]